MKISQLTQILKVAELHSMSKAADELYVAKQNISTAITSLEEELGITIFIRTRNGMVLTADGEKIVDYAKEIMAIYKKMRTLNDRTTLNLNISTHASATFLPFLLASYSSINSTQLALASEQCSEHMLDKLMLFQYDAAIVNLNTNILQLLSEKKYENLYIHILFSDEIVFLIHSQLNITNFSELKKTKIPFVVYQLDEDYKKNEYYFVDNDAIYVSDIETFRTLIESGVAVGTSTKSLLNANAQRYSENIIYLENDVALDIPPIKVALIFNKKNTNVASSQLINLITDMFKPIHEPFIT